MSHLPLSLAVWMHLFSKSRVVGEIRRYNWLKKCGSGFGFRLQVLFEPVKKWGLALQYPCACLVHWEPCGAVDLRNNHPSLRSRRPFDLACVAHQTIGFAVAFRRPGGDDFSAGLFQFPERDSLGGCGEASLFFKLAAGRGPGIFLRIVFPFGDRPRPQILFGPQGAARMNEEYFE